MDYREREEFESSDESEDEVDMDIGQTAHGGHTSKAKHDLMMKSEVIHHTPHPPNP